MHPGSGHQLRAEDPRAGVRRHGRGPAEHEPRRPRRPRPVLPAGAGGLRRQRSRRRHPRRPAGPEDPARHLRRRARRRCSAGQHWTITTRDVPGDVEIAGTTYEGLPGDVAVGDPILIDDGKVRLRVTGVERHRRRDRGAGRRQGEQPQGHQPARRRRLRPGAVGEGHRGPPLRAAPRRRLHRAVVRARRQGRRRRARDHGRGGHPPARHRQDREAPGDRQPRRRDRRLRRLHGRPRRPGRRVPARGRAVPAEAGRASRPGSTPSR